MCHFKDIVHCFVQLFLFFFIYRSLHEEELLQALQERGLIDKVMHSLNLSGVELGEENIRVKDDGESVNSDEFKGTEHFQSHRHSKCKCNMQKKSLSVNTSCCFGFFLHSTTTKEYQFRRPLTHAAEAMSLSSIDRW